MCGERRFDDASVAPDVAAFARVLREVFSGERWEDVEPCAHRAWQQIGLITGTQWEQVRETVESAWRLH
jgi:hypothetical protein